MPQPTPGGGPSVAPDQDDVIDPVIPNAAQAVGAANAQAETMSALQNLGYSPAEAATAVATALGEIDAPDTSALVRLALKKLAPKANQT